VKSSEEVTREVVAELDTSAADEHEAASRTGASGTAVVPEPDYERFLELLQRREREEREATAARLLAARGRETTLYAAHLTAAVLTVVLAFLAVGLALAGVVPVAVASAAIAIIPGSGTVLLRRMWKQERSLRDVLDERRNGHAEIIDAIEGTLSVPDPAERSRLAGQLAERLQERAFADRRA
jgi:Flp pilus assembly protein TadB